MDTNKEVRRAFLNLGFYGAKHPEETINWNEIAKLDPKDAPHSVRIYVDPGTIEYEIARKNELFVASAIVGLISDITFIESEPAILMDGKE